MYVSANPISLGVSAEIEAGTDQTLVGGCDCIVASYRGTDKLKRFTLQLNLGLLEPGLVEMLTGGEAQLDGGGAPIGIWYPTNLSCSDTPQPNIAFEAWQDAWDVDHPDADFPYVHYLWASSFWQQGDFTLENDFAQPVLNGFTRGNANWGLGIFGDQIEAAPASGAGWWLTDTRPDADCTWQSWAIT